MASTLSDLLQSLRSDAEGKVEGDLSPALMKALETYSRSYSATMTSLQKSYERGLTGLEKKLGEMAAAYEATAVSNSEDARALIRELLTSQKKANQQQSDLNAQWRDLAESYFPQISKEQLLNEIAKRKETQKRLDLLKQELGLDKERWEIAKEQRKASIQPEVQKLDTQMGLLDKFGGLGKDPVVGNLVTALKANLQGKKDTLTKGADKDIAEMEKEFQLRTAAFDAMAKQREQNIATFTQNAQKAFAGITRDTKEGGKPPIAKNAPAEEPVEDVPVANAGTPTPTQDNTPPVAQSLSEQAADAAIDRMMASQPDLPTGVAPVANNTATAASGALGSKVGAAIDRMMASQPDLPTGVAPVANNTATAASGALGSKVGALNLGGIGSALSGVISKGLSSLGNVLFKALGPLGWLASIGQSIDGVLPIFSSTFGALYDVLRLAGPFITSLALEGVTTLLTGINGIASIIDEFIHFFKGQSMREKAEKSGALESARARAQEAVQKRDEAVEKATGGFTTYNPLAGVGDVRVGRTAAPTLLRNETALTTPSEERAMAETAISIPAPAPQDQSALVAALQRITAPQNPGTTAIMPSSPYLQPFAV